RLDRLRAARRAREGVSSTSETTPGRGGRTHVNQSPEIPGRFTRLPAESHRIGQHEFIYAQVVHTKFSWSSAARTRKRQPDARPSPTWVNVSTALSVRTGSPTSKGREAVFRTCPCPSHYRWMKSCHLHQRTSTRARDPRAAV